MKVIIIAAGSAKRLKEQTQDLPKGLLDINGKTILERQFVIFNQCDINDIIIIVGPNREKFPFQNVKYLYDSEFENHDVLGSFMVAKSLFDQEILVSYSDILFDRKIISTILNDNSDIGIAVDFDWKKSYQNRTQHPIEQADNVLIENKKIIRIKKNIQDSKKGQKIGEFVGLMKLSKKGASMFIEKFSELEQTHKGPFQDASSFKKAYLTDMLQELIDQGIEVKPIEIKGEWCEIDTPQDLENARKKFK